MLENSLTQTSSLQTAISLLPAVSKPATKKPNANSQIDLSDACPEILYGEACAADDALSSDGGKMNRWVGDHWEYQPETNMVGHALTWLARNARKRAKADTATSCARTAVHMVRKLPEPAGEILVPIKDAWLVLKNGQWHAEQPNREVGVCYRITSGAKIPMGPYTPSPVPDSSLFGRFLAKSLPDPAVQNAVQEYIGYTLCSSVAPQKAQMWIGSGSNGKSVMMNLARAIHGRAVSMRLDKLNGFDLPVIVGASLVIVDEMPNSRINQTTLKTLISGGVTQINPKFAQPFTYQPTAKWIVSGNHLPTLTDHSHGWWRRFDIVEWNTQLSDEEIIPDLDKLIIKTELQIVIDWALAGLTRVIARDYRLSVPTAMKQAMKSAHAHSNNVQDWVDQRGVDIKNGAATDKAILYGHYVKHCRANGERDLPANEFFKRLKVIFPKANETKRIVGEAENKRRARCLDLIIGEQWDDLDEPSPFAN